MTTGLREGCDTHVHVVGDPLRYPMSPQRHYTPGPASPHDLIAHLARVGLERAVLIQPSVYGFDNRCLFDALQELGGLARAVVVVDRDVSPASLERMERLGARGIRLNLESAGDRNLAKLQNELEFWAPRLADLGWHIQLYAPHEVLAACADTLSALRVPCVLDHVAIWKDASLEAPSSHALLRALRSGNVYIKLSASYRVPLAAPALQSVVTQLLRTRSDRLLWASDWPHTSRSAEGPIESVSPYRAIASADLVAERARWLPDEQAMHQVCVANPARLYRF